MLLLQTYYTKTRKETYKMKKTQISQKKVRGLSIKEKEEITSLITRYCTNIEQEYIDNRITEKCQDDIVLLKDGNSTLGVSYYKIDKIVTPFTPKAIPVIKFGQALKVGDYPKSVIWKLGNWYAKRNISYFYPMKEIVGVSTILSPKVFEHFTKLFPNHFPNVLNIVGSQDLIPFLNEYFNTIHALRISIDTNFCSDYPGLLEREITADWEKMYKAKDERINKLFISAGIIEFRGNKIYQSKKSLVVCGYRNPLSKFKRKK